MGLGIPLLACFFAAMGVVALIAPNQVTARFGMPAITPDSRSEVKAVYGGYGIAMGILLGLAPSLPQFRDGILLTVAVALIGMAVGRVVAALGERPGRCPIVFFVVECVLAGIACSALG